MKHLLLIVLIILIYPIIYAQENSHNIDLQRQYDEGVKPKFEDLEGTWNRDM